MLLIVAMKLRVAVKIYSIKNRVTLESFLLPNGETTSPSIGWITSDFIEVPQESIVVGQVRYIHEYDKYFEPVVDSYVDLGTVTPNHTFTPKSNTKYFRFSYYLTSTPIQVEVGSVATAYEEHYYSAFVDGKKVYDFIQEVIDEDTIDYPNVNIKKINPISNFDDGTWERNIWLPGVSEDDVINVTYGSKSLKLSTTNLDSGELLRAVTLDISDKVFIMKIFIEDILNVSAFQITFFSGGTSDYFGYYPPLAQLKTGWNLIAVPTDVFVPKNEDTPISIKESIENIIIRMTAKANVTASITFDTFGLTQNAIKRGKVVLQFDDGQDGVWKYAKPVMDKYGFKGMVYVIKDLVNVNNFMTLDQLKVLYNNGWDLGTHGQIELTTLQTPEAIKSELLSNYNYLIDNGFTRSAKHYCTPAGKYNNMVLAEIKKMFFNS